jgi:hypothetical protein
MRNPFPPGRWEEAMDRAGYGCEVYNYDFPSETRCARQLVVHHRKPRGMGGTFDPAIHDLDNLVVLCDAHHVEVHHRPEWSYASGLLIRR